MKHKRVWTDEQRQAAAERMRSRMAQKKEKESAVVVEERPQSSDSFPTVTRVRAPEVQAVLDTMTPERKAKLANIQAQNLARLGQTKEGREALERLEARHTTQIIPDDRMPGHVATYDENPNLTKAEVREIFEKPIAVIADPPKPIVREVPMRVPFRLTGSVSGMMVSELGPCQCGEPKLKWHPVCLKVRV